MDDVLTTISQASSHDLDVIGKALQNRHRTLIELDRATVLSKLTVGTQVRIDGAKIRPQYLGGLEGKVTQIRGERVTIQLDKTNAGRLAYASRKYMHLFGVDSYDLEGLPASSLVIL